MVDLNRELSSLLLVLLLAVLPAALFAILYARSSRLFPLLLLPTPAVHRAAS